MDSVAKWAGTLPVDVDDSGAHGFFVGGRDGGGDGRVLRELDW
jgi:hypothetical protein